MLDFTRVHTLHEQNGNRATAQPPNPQRLLQACVLLTLVTLSCSVLFFVSYPTVRHSRGIIPGPIHSLGIAPPTENCPSQR